MSLFIPNGKPSLNSAYVGLIDFVNLCKLRLSFVARNDCINIGIGKFATPVPFFGNFIHCVVSFCSQAKVSGIHAWRIVAKVKNNLSFRDRPDKIFVGVPMRSDWLFSRHQKNSVPVLVPSSFPQPASIRLKDTILEHVRRPKYRELIKTAFISHLNVMITTQLPANRICSADSARDYPIYFVGHGSLRFVRTSQLYDFPVEVASVT